MLCVFYVSTRQMDRGTCKILMCRNMCIYFTTICFKRRKLFYNVPLIFWFLTFIVHVIIILLVGRWIMKDMIWLVYIAPLWFCNATNEKGSQINHKFKSFQMSWQVPGVCFTFNLATFLCLSLARTWISISKYCDLFFVLWF